MEMSENGLNASPGFWRQIWVNDDDKIFLTAETFAFYT